MATLQTKLDRIRANFEAQAPAEAREIMHRATSDLEASGAHKRALGEGAQLPAFSLPNQDGVTVASQDLLSRGPLVITVFRGHW